MDFDFDRLPDENEQKLNKEFSDVISQFYSEIIISLREKDLDKTKELISLLRLFAYTEDDEKFEIIMEVLNKLRRVN